MSQPDGPLTHIFPANYELQTLPPHQSHHLYAFIDSDWTGVVIGFMTRHQGTIAQSSTEADFVAAADAVATQYYTFNPF